MDMSFLRRAQRLLAERTPARLDYGVLVATLEAVQSASEAARAEVRSARTAVENLAACGPLVEILLAAPAWSEAIDAQEGSFNRDVARPDLPGS